MPRPSRIRGRDFVKSPLVTRECALMAELDRPQSWYDESMSQLIHPHRPRIVITGCGRTGTLYTCNLLALCGFRACHETIYCHEQSPDFPDLDKIDEQWRHECFEVSWQAAPFIQYFTAETVVLHQTRNPLKSLRCWTVHHMLREENPTCELVHKVFPECAVGTDLERAVAYHVLWNQLIEMDARSFAYQRFQVEKLDFDLVCGLLEYSQVPITELDDVLRSRIRFALQQSPRDINSCTHGPEDDITWDMVLKTPRGQELKDMAERYGY